MTRELADEVRDEQIKVLYRQARVVFIPNVVAGPAIVYVLWDQIPAAWLLAWWAALYLVTGARAVMVWVHGRRARSLAENRRWGWNLAGINALSGAMWGVAGFFFISDAEPLSQAFVIVTLAAMTAGAVSSLSAFLPAYVMFAIPCVAPLIARALLEWHDDAGSRTGTTWLALAILAFIYLAVHLVFARNTQRTLAESIRLRFEKLDLVDQLTVQKERAEAANVAKSKFLAAASHDLRQPMHALGLFIDALRGEPHAQRAARIVDSVTESHLAATGLLDNLLEFSRVDAGIVKAAVASFPVQRLLDQLRAEYTVQASAADLELRIRPCRAFVRSDPVLLSRMVGNLVSNAIRYTDEGRILIGCRRVAGKLRIEVHDSGIGIAKEQHQAIFREFFQIDEGARRGGRPVGMGLGLAIVSGLSQALDHPVRIASTPGKGSVFAVTVPIGEPVAAAVRSEVALTDNLKGKTVLVIDDEAAIRDAVADVLMRWGCLPVTAAGPEQAAELFRVRGGCPDALVVDYQLDRGASGLDAIAHLAAVFGHSIPAIIVTGDTQPERLREASEIGYPLLHKPLAPMRLRAALSAALAAPTIVPAFRVPAR
jgi:signal transduction histidine kinase